MKFAQYLQDHQTPEWKKAYIDYRKLKAQLRVIRANARQKANTPSFVGNKHAARSYNSAPTNNQNYSFKEMYVNQGNATLAHITSVCASGSVPTKKDITGPTGHPPAPLMSPKTNNREDNSKWAETVELDGWPNVSGSPFSLALASIPLHGAKIASTTPSQQAPLSPRARRSPVFSLFEDLGSPALPPLYLILSNLPGDQVKFFDMLDVELNKVEKFYLEREQEMQERARMLRKQLSELGMHRDTLRTSDMRSDAQSQSSRASLESFASSLSSFIQWLPDSNAKLRKPRQVGRNAALDIESGNSGCNSSFDSSALVGKTPGRGYVDVAHARSRGKDSTIGGSKSPKCNTKGAPTSPCSSVNLSTDGKRHPLDPQEYEHAKSVLRNAIIEHYRGLEVLKNYRTLNLAGFRRALKGYEKITGTSVLDTYTKEKVELSAFASSAMISTMLEEMERLFVARFGHGDKKKAIEYLRVGPLSKTHHFSAFHSGVWLGLAIPAIAGGVYLSFQEYTQRSLPSLNILLFVYSILLVPVLLALLIGINILVWVRKNINYTFILELSPRSRLDHHEYFELPSFLLCTLAYAFSFSMAQIGPPMLWPLIWLALTLVVMLNPIRNFMWGRARWWTIKNIAKLGISGMWKVEFTDVWLGDQICSLVYSLSNLYFVGCLYSRLFVDFPSSASLYTSFTVNATTTHQAEFSISTGAFRSLLSSAYDPHIQDAWSTCSISQHMGWYYVLGVLPYMVRFVQSMRRYLDSKLSTQLINAGKYATGMMYYFVYCYWKHKGSPNTGEIYVLWCFTATINSIYGCAWDFLMDWSVCEPYAKYPLLRQELIYESQILCYYFALVSNLCVRFIWLSHIFLDPNEANSILYAFIAAMLEMLRRVQWNFYRLENEHLGNMHQFNNTYEVPLPYVFDEHSDKVKGHGRAQGALSWLKQHMILLKKREGSAKSVV